MELNTTVCEHSFILTSGVFFIGLSNYLPPEHKSKIKSTKWSKRVDIFATWNKIKENKHVLKVTQQNIWTKSHIARGDGRSLQDSLLLHLYSPLSLCNGTKVTCLYIFLSIDRQFRLRAVNKCELGVNMYHSDGSAHSWMFWQLTNMQPLLDVSCVTF